MSLRSKLLAGYLLFVAGIGALGVWSAYLLSDMGGVSRRIIADNYDSVVAAQQMKESLERQDSAAVFFLLGERELASAQLEEHRARFDDAYTKAANNITESGEQALIESIGRHRAEYYSRYDEFLISLGQGKANAVSSREYFSELKPRFDRLRSDSQALLTLNQEAMRRKADEATAAARTWFQTTIGVTIALALLGVLLAVWLSANVVRPVRELTDAARRIGGGDLESRAAVRSSDEVGTLAQEFNKMADHLRELRQSDLGRIVLAQRTAEAAVDALYDPVIVTDGRGRVTRLNEAAEKLFGPEDQARDREIANVSADPRIALAVDEALTSERSFDAEGAAALVTFGEGEYERAFRLRVSPMREEGKMLGAVVLLEDVTKLREVDRMKTEFIATASHELRTPLTSAQMGIHLLLEEAAGELTDKQREVLEVCREDCARLERLMRDLLDLSKFEAGEFEPVLIPIAPAALLGGAVKMLRFQAESRGLEFVVDVPDGLPAVLADRVQIERAVGNLITNAIRNTPKGGEISVAAARRDDSVAVTVADTGVGIPAEYLPRIFDRFVQVPGAAAGGAGLGLAITRRIVESHGGEIVVQSTPGRGTAFTFSLREAGRPEGAPSPAVASCAR